MKKTVFLGLSIVFFILISISGFAETTYGNTWEETCEGGVCTRSLYSGYSPSFFENNLTNLESLKDYYDVVYLKYDGDHDIIVNDFNLTWIDFNLTFDGNYSENEYEEEDGKVKMKFKIGHPNGTEYEYEMEVEDNRTKIDFVLDNVLLYNYIFGGNSTTVQLQDANTENLDDGSARRYQGVGYEYNETEWGARSSLIFANDSNWHEHGAIKFDLPTLPTSSTLNSSELCFYAGVNNLEADEGFNISNYLIYNNYSWTEGTGDSLGDSCEGNEFCWATMPNSSYYNTTAEDSINISDVNVSQWLCWNTLNMINYSFENSYDNISIFLKSHDLYGSPSYDNIYLRSKEWSTSSERPYLNYTYTLGSEAMWYDNQSSLPSEYNPDSLYEFNITWNTTDSSVANISIVFIEINLSSGTTNFTATNDTYGGDIFNYTLTIDDLCIGTYYWKSYANDTLNNIWNTSDTWTFTIAKNATNPVHLNISNDNYATNTTNNNISVETDHTVKIHAYMGYSSAGTVGLYIDGTSQTNPYSNTFGEGAHAIKVNTSGNANYSANATGLTYYVIATSPTGGGTTGGGGSFQIIAPNVSFTLEPENPVLIAPLKTEFVQNISYKVCSQHTNELSIDVDFNYENIKAIMEKPFIVLPGECEIFDVEVTVFNLTEGKEYSIGMVATDINSREFRTSTITITTSFVSGTIKDVIGFFMSKLSWSYTIDGAHPITIPYMGLWTSLGAFVVVFWLITKGFKGQYRIRRLRGNKSLPFVVSTIVMILLLVFLIPI